MTERINLEKRVVVDYAKKNNCWIDDLYSLGIPISGGGNENTLAINLETGFIYKANNLMNANGSVLQLLDQIQTHNEIFPETAYEIEGITGYDFGKNNIPIVEPILKQRYIPNAIKAVQQDIDCYMNSLGFEKINDHTFKNNKYIVSDLRPRNVLKDNNGIIYVIDDIAHLITDIYFKEVIEIK